jgi:23S rRNA (cytosine1962-C5)-methyltransferase
MQAALTDIVTALGGTLRPRAIVLRGDNAARSLEGLPEEVKLVAGDLQGPVRVEENGAVFQADVLSGQKTGWFFDQRDNRAFMAKVSRGATVVDLYTHTGGFAIAAARAGAKRVTAVDSSQHALDLAAAAATENGVADRVGVARADVYGFLEQAARRHETWQVVIADPPAFVKSRKDVKAGLQGYRKLARLCAAVTAPGGWLFVASCSHNAPVDEFTAAVARGVHDAGRAGRIVRSAGAGADHPVHPMLPESAYLKAVVLALD